MVVAFAAAGRGCPDPVAPQPPAHASSRPAPTRPSRRAPADAAPADHGGRRRPRPTPSTATTPTTDAPGHHDHHRAAGPGAPSVVEGHGRRPIRRRHRHRRRRRPRPSAPPTPPSWPASASVSRTTTTRRSRPAGNYRGAYQFNQPAWDATARHAGRPDLVGRLANTGAPRPTRTPWPSTCTTGRAPRPGAAPAPDAVAGDAVGQAGGRVTLTRREAVELLERHGLSPSRALGQNFLVDPNTVRRIARLAGVGPGDPVVEIGAGLGLAHPGAGRRPAPRSWPSRSTATCCPPCARSAEPHGVDGGRGRRPRPRLGRACSPATTAGRWWPTCPTTWPRRWCATCSTTCRPSTACWSWCSARSASGWPPAPATRPTASRR